MKSEICSDKKCTGCSSCANACPQNCISMLSDSEGFLRPVVDENLCINCGKCKIVCPINHSYIDDKVEPLTYAVRNNDKYVRKCSSSGGVFSALAESIWKQKGCVIAVGFDENNQAVHKLSMNNTILDELRRSKYVQSKIGSVYREAEIMLNAGKSVLFCGTPCQIAGFKSYLQKDYKNIFTIDFICHGVPSPLAWNKYLSFRQEMMNSPIKSISFRSKETGWGEYSMRIDFSNNKSYLRKVTEDPYLRSFIMNMTLRPSCYDCQFKHIHRQSDITLADFWGIERFKPEWNDDSGVSLVMINSERGKKIFDSCTHSFEYEQVEFKEAVSSNPSMTHSSNKPGLRNSFFIDLNKLSFDQVHRKYCGQTIFCRLRRLFAKFFK